MTEVITTVPCPDCGKPLTEISGCGSTTWFCPACGKPISRSRLTFSDKKTQK